jgi:hypothetical protein
MWLRLKYFFRLWWELYQYARLESAWWLFALVALLFAISAFVVVGQTIAPFVYTIF